MQIIRGIKNIKPEYRNCVATIGNFDGVHLGHQAVLRQLVDKAQELGLPAIVIVFEPQPQEYFVGDKAPARLTRLREKYEVLARFPLQVLLVLRFNKAFSELSADEFIKKILVQGLAIKHLVVGDDFRFGKGRLGNFQTLLRAGNTFGFEVENTKSYEFNDVRVSSTRIRYALLLGDFEKAGRLLGRQYTLSGKVAHGQKRGRSIGFPTANIFLKRYVVPFTGVFAVKVHGLGHQALPGVANLGSRPTVDGSRVILEVHLFDLNQDIYGCYVQVEFVKKIRDEVRFDDFQALKQQISLDVIEAKRCFTDFNS